MSWDKPLIFKELTEVYIVNSKRFWTRREAEMYVVGLEMEEIGRISGEKRHGKSKKLRK